MAATATWCWTTSGLDERCDRHRPGHGGASANQPTNPAVGPNQLQNYPTLTLAQRTSSTNPEMLTRRWATAQRSEQQLFRIDIYLGACHPTAPTRGVAQYWMGHLLLTSDAQGNATFQESFDLASGLGWYEQASATATSVSGGDTSEIGECEPVMPIELPDALFQNGFEST